MELALSIRNRPDYNKRDCSFLYCNVREEPGVLCIFPMQDAEKPTSIRIVEIYRDEAAYKSHLATPHFLRYKTGTPHMIESLRLAPMRPLDPTIFPDVFRKSPTQNTTAK